MRDLPLIRNDAMVRAILDGHKRQTRTPVCIGQQRRQPMAPWEVEEDGRLYVMGEAGEHYPAEDRLTSPFGQAGDRLWVREAWRLDGLGTLTPPTEYHAHVGYRADGGIADHTVTREAYGRALAMFEAEGYASEARWRPSIHMPRWASRITLPVVRVWVERVQDITEEGARAEGITEPAPVHGKWVNPREVGGGHWSYRKPFADLWESLYPGSWDRNEWVWACEFGEPEVRSACAR